jgi:hypothetical protein
MKPAVNRQLSRVMLSTAAIVAAVIFAATLVLFLGGSLYLFLLSMTLTPAAAALVVGLVGLTVAMLIVLVVRRLSRPRPPGAEALTIGNGVNDLAAQLGGLVGRQIASHTHAHPYGAVGVALVAGLVIGASPELRKVLMGALKR